MLRLNPLLLVAVISLAGCAGEPKPILTSHDHPASSHAQAGAMPMMPGALALGDQAPSGINAPMKMDLHDHAAHDDAAADPHAGHAHGEAKPEAGSPLYACPMHPEVTSNLPDQNCPKCGMKLKLKSEIKDPS